MKVALISDIHANFFALETVVQDLDKECVESVIVAGDLIGYYYWPHKVVDLIMSDSRFFCIRGNHERMFKEALVDNNIFERYRKKYGSGFDVCKKMLDKTQLNWILSLPETLSVKFDNREFFVAHGSLKDDKDYIYPDSSLSQIISNYSQKEFTVLGNTHYPFIHHNDGKYLINPGSVGQPRDESAMSSYVIINLETGVIKFKRKKFEIVNIIKEANKNDPELPFLQNVLRR